MLIPFLIFKLLIPLLLSVVIIVIIIIIKVIINTTTVANAALVKLQPIRAEFLVCYTKPRQLGASVLWSSFHY